MVDGGGWRRRRRRRGATRRSGRGGQNEETSGSRAREQTSDSLRQTSVSSFRAQQITAPHHHPIKLLVARFTCAYLKHAVFPSRLEYLAIV